MNNQHNEQAESQPTPGKQVSDLPQEPASPDPAEEENLPIPIGVPIPEAVFRRLKEQAKLPHKVPAPTVPTEPAEADPAED